MREGNLHFLMNLCAPPSALIQRRLQRPLAKRKFLAVAVIALALPVCGTAAVIIVPTTLGNASTPAAGDTGETFSGVVDQISPSPSVPVPYDSNLWAKEFSNKSKSNESEYHFNLGARNLNDGPTLIKNWVKEQEVIEDVKRKVASQFAERKIMDQTIWADEVEAQQYEIVFTRFWDRIRESDDEGKFKTLAEFPLSGPLTFGTPGPPEILDGEVTLVPFLPDSIRTINPEEWGDFVRSFEGAGFRILQTEWHHSKFLPDQTTQAPQSIVSFSIHAYRVGEKEKLTTFEIKGDLNVQWAEKGKKIAQSIAVTNLTMQERSGGGQMRQVRTFEPGPDDFKEAYPIIVYDLDGDGLSEIIMPRWNRVYRNSTKGNGRLTMGALLEQPVKLMASAIVSDFTGDGNADLIAVATNGVPHLFAGTAEGTFPHEGVACAKIRLPSPSAITAGDADGDGDLDLWITQYKPSFFKGQMPTPFYDANDGYPSYYLKNDGSGSFHDATEGSGLDPLRNRRTYSASFIDLDEDGDLDLMNVSDYAGLDIYENDGEGSYTLATDEFVDGRHFFGMGHTFGDYNQDGLVDFYVIGMSSTTARRLDRLGLGRDDRPDVHPMRAAMGYGNRLYFGTKEKAFREDPKSAAEVARTGWAWGATTFDFDLDGDQDIYVANGHRSGDTSKDYCSTFWRHDIYTGNSKDNKAVLDLFRSTLIDINTKKISWNGYEKNVLLVNNPDRLERFRNSAFMYGAAYEFDSRSVISDDLNGDGRPDLIMAEAIWNGSETELSLKLMSNDIKSPFRHWITVQLRESAGLGFSPNGAKVTIVDDLGRSQSRWIVTGDSYLAQHAPVAHFGLGDATQVETIEVNWPNGKTERHEADGAVDTTIILRGGSPGRPSR
jgi:hypothetical protein